VIDDAVGFVDVVESAIAKAAHGRVIFFAGDIVVSFIEQFHSAMKTSGTIHACIDGRMIVQVLAVIDCSPFDFFNGFVNLVNRVFFFFVHVMGGSEVFEVSAGVPQISECVQIGRMPSRFVGKAQCSGESHKKDY